MCLEETPCAHLGCPRTTYTRLTDFCSTPDCNIILQSHAPATTLCDGCTGLDILLRDSREAEKQRQQQQELEILLHDSLEAERQQQEQQGLRQQQRAGQIAWPYTPLRPPTPPPSTQLCGESTPLPALVSNKSKRKGRSPTRGAGTGLERIPEEGTGGRGEVAPEPSGAGRRRRRTSPRRRRGEEKGKWKAGG